MFGLILIAGPYIAGYLMRVYQVVKIILLSMKLYQLAEIYVQLDLLKQGYEVFTPIHDHSPIDLIAVKGSTTLKIQVKNSTFLRDNKINFRLKNEKGKYKNCDYYALVEPILNKIWYLPMSEAPTTYKTININEIKELPKRHDPTEPPSARDK